MKNKQFHFPFIAAIDMEMADYREGQKGVLVFFQEEFLTEIDRRFPTLGYSDRSSFVRDAVYELLSRHGVNVLREKSTAPPRTGKDYSKGKAKAVASGAGSIAVSQFGKKNLSHYTLPARKKVRPKEKKI